MMWRVLSLSLAGVVLSGATYAADLPMYEDVPMVEENVPHDWTGPHIGIQGGFGFERVPFNFIDAGISDTTDYDGAFVGGTVGINLQRGMFVVGLEGDAEWSAIDGSEACIFGGSTCRIDIDWFGTGRARAGVAFDRVLVFGTGGLAFADVNFNTTPGPGFTGQFDEVFLGYILGVGAEVALTKRISAKGEFRYYDFGTETAPTGTLDISRTRLPVELLVFKAGLNINF